MRASIIIVSYNSVADLPGCLDAALCQCGPDDELIVVDNGSCDGSAALVAKHYPTVRLLQSNNTGYAGGNNRGARQARGAYLVFLNPDAILEPGALAALLAPLEQPEVALTTACVVYADRPDTVNACGNTMHVSGLTFCRGVDAPCARYAASCDVDAISGAACAIRRDLFAKLGGFDEQFFMYVEDSDLSLRARLAGYRCWYVADARVRHAYAAAFEPTKVYYLDRNRHLMLLKNLRRATYLRLLPTLLLAEVVTWGFNLWRGPRYWGIKPRVYAALWQQRHAIGAARHAALARHRRSDRELVASFTPRLAFAPLAPRSVARLASFFCDTAFWGTRLALRIPATN